MVEQSGAAERSLATGSQRFTEIASANAQELSDTQAAVTRLTDTSVRLLELIQAKQKGKKPPVVQSAERPANVVNLFDALKKSLAGEDGEAEAKLKSTKKAAPARAAAKKPAAKTRKAG